MGLAAAPALAGHAGSHGGANNAGTIKVHDNEDENPDVRNVPHVSCDFWIEGFNMNDDSGWLEFYSWPPTGNMSLVTPTGDDLMWTADSTNEQGNHHFEKGPYRLDPGHYRVEVYTDAPHPGSEDHFAKAKMFWVDPCVEEGDEPRENPPCPTNLQATAESDGDVRLTWDTAEGAVSYNIYRTVEGGDFDYLATTTDTTYTDTTTEVGVTYEYIVTAFDGESESVDCDSVTVTAIPFFPSLMVGAVALAGSVGAFALISRTRRGG